MNRFILSKASKVTFRRIGVSIAVSFGILMAEYFLSNWVGHVFDDTSLLSVVNKIIPTNHADSSDDIVFFNVGYDKQLVAVRDEYGDSIGNTVITDRTVLLKLLEIAEQSNYRYLFLDIRFEKELSTPVDSILFTKLASMSDLVISSHSNIDQDNIKLHTKTGLADYVSTYFSGFSKYGFLQDDSASVALKMYREIDGGDVRRFGPLFFSDGTLCNNLQLLTFSDADIAKTETPAFGGEYLRILPPEQLSDYMSGKIIAVGDMSNDVHSTYIGSVPGPVLSIRAYEALRAEHHYINFQLQLLLFTVYTLCSYIILYANKCKFYLRLTNVVHRLPLLSFGTFLLGWSFVLLVLKIIVFVIYQYSIIMTIPSVVFSILSMPSGYSDFKRKL